MPKPPPTLLGHLAGFGSFSSQSEVLCTQGLAYLLDKYADAHSALVGEVRKHTGVDIGESLAWIAEATQSDRGIPDLEAHTADEHEVPWVKIEAKLGAELGDGQLESYVADLEQRNPGQSALLVLVPKTRKKKLAETTFELLEELLGLSGLNPWPANDAHRIAVAVISWDELFEALAAGKDERLLFELEQLEAMYRTLIGDDIAELASAEELEHWREHETDLRIVVDRLTRRLTGDGKLLPLGTESCEDARPDCEPVSYYRRYVCVPGPGKASCYSIGVRDSFARDETSVVTPIWMRFHKDTGEFAHIEERIATLDSVPSEGHRWLPLEVPLKASGEEMIESLIKQAKDILRVAYPNQ